MTTDIRAAKRRGDGARPVKHSFAIAGHRTSISLEAAFWTSLKAAAETDGVALTTLVARIDAERGTAGLSSAIRVWLLRRAEARAAEAITWSSS
jgi:predicted DNA-binding ribbon-helix-helix protein